MCLQCVSTNLVKCTIWLSIILEFFSFYSYVLDFGLEGGVLGLGSWVLGLGLGSCGPGLEVCVLGLALWVMSLLTSLSYRPLLIYCNWQLSFHPLRNKVTETEYNFKTLRRLTIHQTKSSILLFNAKVGNGVYWPKINLNGSNFHDNMRSGSVFEDSNTK